MRANRYSSQPPEPPPTLRAPPGDAERDVRAVDTSPTRRGATPATPADLPTVAVETPTTFGE